jgi:simple sugar transport system permease protein
MATSKSNQPLLKWSLPFKVLLEPRLEQPRWLSLTISIGAIILGLLFGAIVFLIVGLDPIRAYSFMFSASFGSIGVISDTLTKATPLILTGLAATIAFKMRLWNIGGEGQFYAGAFGASAVVLTPLIPLSSPSWLIVLAMLAGGILAGTLWSFIPGFLKAKYNVNEIITTLMMNYIVIDWNNFFIFTVWSDHGFQMSRIFPKSSWLPRLTDFSDRIPSFAGLTTHLGLVLGIFAAIGIWWILYRSRWGYEIRVIGDNPHAARVSGINTKSNIVLVMCLSGALAGLAGASEISGVVHRLQDGISSGYGFSGIIIAWLSKLNPILVIPISILFGALILGGREIQPSGISSLIQGMILVFLIASEFFLRYRVVFTKNFSEE